MANGPLGGFMPTPAAPAQPPQVKLDTTADSRGNFNNFLKNMNGATLVNPPVVAPVMGAMTPNMAPALSNIDIFNQPVQMMQEGGVADFGDFFDEVTSVADDDRSDLSDDNIDTSSPDSDMDYTDVFSSDDLQQATDIGRQTGGDDTPSVPNVVFNNQAILNATKDLPEGNQTQIQFKKDIVNTLQDYAKDNDLAGALNQFQIEAADGDKRGENIVNSIIQASNVNPAAYSAAVFNKPTASDILGASEKSVMDALDLTKPVEPFATDRSPGRMQAVFGPNIGSTLGGLTVNEAMKLAGITSPEQEGRITFDPESQKSKEQQLADQVSGILGIGVPVFQDQIQRQALGMGIKPELTQTALDPFVSFDVGNQARDIQRALEQGTLAENLDKPEENIFSNMGPQSELDQAPSATRRLGFASSKIPNQFDETASGEAFAGGDVPLSVAPFTKTTPDEPPPIVAPGIGAPKEFEDQFPGAGIKIGNFTIPTIFSLANQFSKQQRGRVLDSIAQKGYTPVYGGKNNDVIVGARDPNTGILMEGIDPNQELGGDDSGPDPIIRPRTPEPEVDKPDLPPNVIGGTSGQIGNLQPVTADTVVASPFAPASSGIQPVTFDSGELNKLIELLTGVPARPVVAKQEGGLVNAVDEFLASAS